MKKSFFSVKAPAHERARKSYRHEAIHNVASLAWSSLFGARRHRSHTTKRRRRDCRWPWTIRVRSFVLAKDTPTGSTSIGQGYETAGSVKLCCV